MTTGIDITNNHHQFPKEAIRDFPIQYQEVVVNVAESAIEDNGDDDEDVVDDREANDGEDDEALEDEEGDGPV